MIFQVECHYSAEAPMLIDSIVPYGQQKKTPAPEPTASPTPTPTPEPTPTPTPTTTSAPPTSSTGSQPASSGTVVQITTMRDAVRQAVIDARTRPETAKWIELPPRLPAQAGIEQVLIRSKADILAEASQAMVAQANQTRDSVMSLLQAPG